MKRDGGGERGERGEGREEKDRDLDGFKIIHPREDHAEELFTQRQVLQELVCHQFGPIHWWMASKVWLCEARGRMHASKKATGAPSMAESSSVKGLPKRRTK